MAPAATPGLGWLSHFSGSLLASGGCNPATRPLGVVVFPSFGILRVWGAGFEAQGYELRIYDFRGVLSNCRACKPVQPKCKAKSTA